MFAQLICRDRTEKEINELYEVIGALCQRESVQIEDKIEQVEISVCPQGKVVIKEKDNEMDLFANTRHAGAGFHAFVVDFFKDIQEEVPGKYDLIDDLQYADDEDFDKLQATYEDELDYLRGLLKKEEKMRSKNYMYDETFFLPMEKDHEISTAIGYIDIEEFTNLSQQDLVDSFYVWHNWDKDARFYKNAALTLLAKEGVSTYTFMNEMTEKFAHEICDYIELAYEKDEKMPLPLQEYHQLISILGREDKIESGVFMEQEVSQYRLKEVYHLFENAKVVALGTCERSYDPVSLSMNLMAPYENMDQWSWLMQASLEPMILLNKEELQKQPIKQVEKKEVQMLDWQEENCSVLEAILKEGENTLYFHVVMAKPEFMNYLKTCIEQSGFQEEE